MQQSNMALLTWHPCQSRPLNWPLLTGNLVAFWTAREVEVDCIGHVFVYYTAFLGLFAVAGGFHDKKWLMAMSFVVGWGGSYFPFWLIPRSVYLYHYLIPLMFGCLAAGAGMDLWLRPRNRGIVAVLVCFLALVGFWIWSPLAYGTPHLDRDLVIWTRRWTHGDEYHRRLAQKADRNPRG
jgi:dolichyl-phosphate-mannose--protein O-mannosyl transferase